MSAWLVVAYASGYFDGHRGTTVSLSPNDQERGSCMGVLGSFKLPNNLALGSWDERGADAASFCVDRCNACGPTACQFVSISLQYSDCSYYAACNLAALRTFPEGFRTLNVSDSKSTIHQLQHLPARQQSGRRACDWVTAGLRGVDAAAQTNITSTWSMCLYSGTLDSSGVSAAVKKHGCFECGLVRFMLQRLRDASSRHGATLVDIGANVGMYTLAAAAAGHTAHAFEPTPLTVQKLLRSIEVNGFGPLVTLYPMCLGASRVAVALAKSDSNQGFLSHRAGAGRVQLPMLRLDDVLAPIEARDVFLKMDIEGGECDAEKGMQALDASVPQSHAAHRWRSVGVRACHARMLLAVDAAKWLLPSPPLEGWAVPSCVVGAAASAIRPALRGEETVGPRLGSMLRRRGVPHQAGCLGESWRFSLNPCGERLQLERA